MAIVGNIPHFQTYPFPAGNVPKIGTWHLETLESCLCCGRWSALPFLQISRGLRHWRTAPWSKGYQKPSKTAWCSVEHEKLLHGAISSTYGPSRDARSRRNAASCSNHWGFNSIHPSKNLEKSDPRGDFWMICSWNVAFFIYCFPIPRHVLVVPLPSTPVAQVASAAMALVALGRGELYTEDELKTLLAREISKRPWPTVGTVVSISHEPWSERGPKRLWNGYETMLGS